MGGSWRRWWKKGGGESCGEENGKQILLSKMNFGVLQHDNKTTFGVHVGGIFCVKDWKTRIVVRNPSQAGFCGTFVAFVASAKIETHHQCVRSN